MRGRPPGRTRGKAADDERDERDLRPVEEAAARPHPGFGERHVREMIRSSTSARSGDTTTTSLTQPNLGRVTHVDGGDPQLSV